MKYSQLVSMPSAVSDWLEEQLEARGIDGLVYTRYVLSLLHSHTLDIICPDGEDLNSVYLKKEVRRAGGRNKRFSRSSSDWWKHAQADAEQIKRSAAVECLMSASDQNCEIESLVDELCEKLKGKDNDSVKTVEEASTVPLVVDNPHQKITPQELAEKYYAAFPPLRTQYICKGNQQEKSKLLKLMEPKRKIAGSPGRKRVFAGKMASSEEKLHNKLETESMKPRSQQNKQRFPYFSRIKNSACRKLDWEQPALKKSKSKSKSAFEEHRRSFPKADFSDNNTFFGDADFDQCLNVDRCKNSAGWSGAIESDHDMQMYDDLPVDLSELLESPTPRSDDMVEIMNVANMRDDGKRQYIPYGTNIISSIWSADRNECSDNTFNAILDRSGPAETALDMKFRSISINSNDTELGVFVDTSKHGLPWKSFSPISENDTNNFFESRSSENYTNVLLDGFHSLPVDWLHIKSEQEEDGGMDPDSIEYQNLLKLHNASLNRLNHKRGRSGFAEVLPKTMPKAKSYNPFTRQTSFFAFSSRPNISLDREKEDLLTSERTHFKPIVEEIENKVKGQHYADGATFNISNSLDKVEYKRSESGTMFLENEFGQSKKYFEYKIKDSPPTPPDMKFILKVHICQNDKASQTDVDGSSETTAQMNIGFIELISHPNIAANVKGTESLSPLLSRSSCYVEEELNNCTCPVESLFSDNMNVSPCTVHVRARPESILGEVVWNYENRRCEKCNSNNNGTTKGWRDEWCRRGLKDIWSGGEICQTCLNLNSCATPSSGIHSKLREDISQDGEQLLSDLRHLQNAYMEELPKDEVSCNILELVNAAAAAKTTANCNNEQKRRHSIIVAGGENLCVGAPWSFASRLEEDCLIQMSTLPTLRSVTF